MCDLHRTAFFFPGSASRCLGQGGGGTVGSWPDNPHYTSFSVYCLVLWALCSEEEESPAATVTELGPVAHRTE